MRSSYRERPDETGPPVLEAWLRYDTGPGRDDLRRALAGPAAAVPSASRL